MKAAVFYGPDQPLVVEQVELAPPQAGEVLVKMQATGICRSDVKYMMGQSSVMSPPMVMGHEGAGIVEQVGEGVSSVEAGDHVVLTFLPSCGKCHWCHTGVPTLCDLGAMLRNGTMLNGSRRMRLAGNGKELNHFLFVSTFGEYTVCPEASVVKAPKHLPLHRICLLGCGFTTGFGAATNAASIKAGEAVLIVGCGGLGLSATQGAALSGAGKIIAVDVHEEKLDMARKFGATHTVTNRGDVDEVIKEIMEITQGVGTEHAFEFVGGNQTDQTIAIAYNGLCKSGTMYMVGVAQEDKQTMPISPFMFPLLRKNLQGVLFGDAQFRTDLPRYMDMYERGQINLDGLITKEYRLEDINTCFQNVIAGNKVARQIIRYD